MSKRCVKKQYNTRKEIKNSNKQLEKQSRRNKTKNFTCKSPNEKSQNEEKQMLTTQILIYTNAHPTPQNVKEPTKPYPE